MAWTRESQIQHLVRLPWTVVLDRDADGDFVATVAELPFLVASGPTEKAASRDLFEALWTAMDAMLEHCDAVPLPHDELLPWERGVEPPVPMEQHLANMVVGGDAWSPTASSISQSLALPE
jgi:predicted RNase H-like HicB family nuclease